jgi:poly-gamma-glutamate synthesis protein (capsule biosynthesis protein)
MKNKSIRVLCLLLLVFLVSCSLEQDEEEVFPLYRVPDHSLPDDLLRLTFAGDIMAHNVNYQMKDYSEIYSDIRDVLSKDSLSFGNLEFPVDNSRPFSTWPRFNVHASYVRSAVDAGFDVFSLANNHTCDWGESGILQTIRSMDALELYADVYYSGLRREKGKGFGVVTIRYGDWKIGFLAVTQFLNDYRGSEYVYLINYMKEEERASFIDLCRKMTADYDLFILSVHGGIEYARTPHRIKSKFFDEAAEAGVDIIWAHHPHVLQPWTYTQKEGKTQGLIMYSLGNFVSGQTWYLTDKDWHKERAYTGDSALFQVTVGRKNGRATVLGVKPRLISTFIREDRGIVVRKLDNLIAAPLYGDWNRFYRERKKVLALYERELDIWNYLP